MKKIIIVTGASRGIGKEIAKNLVKLTFEVSAEDFDKAINQVYKKNVKRWVVYG